MKRVLFILLLSLFACDNEAKFSTLPDPVPDQEMPASENGLSLQLIENRFSGSPAEIETIIQNDSSQDYNFGGFYHIEVSIEGLWYIITYSDTVFFQNPRFKDFGNTLQAKSETHQTFSVEALSVTLLPGKYRLVKTFLSQGESFHEISVAVPFWIE